jgi:hypothetical protein
MRASNPLTLDLFISKKDGDSSAVSVRFSYAVENCAEYADWRG